MARKRLDERSFDEIVSEPPPARDNVKPANQYDVSTANDEAAKTSTREDVKTLKVDKRPHVSLYVSPAVQKAVKQLALDRNVRAHDLYLDGVRTMLKTHGLDFDKLNAG